MNAPRWLVEDVVSFLHDQTIREFGGVQGVKSQAMLDSALHRPRNKWEYAGTGLDCFDLAAAYAFGLAADHPFNDGNKRTAWASCILFLKLNGVAVAATPLEAVEQVLRLVEGGVDETGFAAWLRASRRG